MGMITKLGEQGLDIRVLFGACRFTSVNNRVFYNEKKIINNFYLNINLYIDISCFNT